MKQQVAELGLPLSVQANNLTVQHRSCIRYSGGDIIGEVGKRREPVTVARDQLCTAMLDYDQRSEAIEFELVNEIGSQTPKPASGAALAGTATLALRIGEFKRYDPLRGPSPFARYTDSCLHFRQRTALSRASCALPA